MQATKANHEVAPLKHASLAHCDNENDTHTHTDKDTHTHTYISVHHTHTHTQQLLSTREASKQFRGILQGAETLEKNANPPNWARQQLRNRRKCQKQHTHTLTYTLKHTHTHVSVKNIKKSEKGKRVPRVFGANFSSSRNFNGKMLICFCIEGGCMSVCVYMCVCLCVCTALLKVCAGPFAPVLK